MPVGYPSLVRVFATGPLPGYTMPATPLHRARMTGAVVWLPRTKTAVGLEDETIQC